MKTSIFTFLLVLTYLIAYNTIVFSQDKTEKTIESTCQKGSGEDPNVKSDTRLNDPNDNTQIPAWKDPNSKGTGPGKCYILVKNYTNWYIDIYIDGYSLGLIGPWGDMYVYTGTGTTKFYAKAKFNDGTYNYWGPSYFDCDYYYTLGLNKPR